MKCKLFTSFKSLVSFFPFNNLLNNLFVKEVKVWQKFCWLILEILLVNTVLLLGGLSLHLNHLIA